MSGGGGERERERERERETSKVRERERRSKIEKRDTIKNNLKKKYPPTTLIRIYKHLIFNW